MRIDLLLVHNGLAASRSQAARLVADGVQWRTRAGEPWRHAAKAGEDVPESAELLLANDRESRYVSRGGLKLEGAMQHCGVAPQGARCLDVGQSTGGFTDCLLQHGAATVLGVDVGHGQLHPKLQADARVLALQKFNARDLSFEKLIAESVRQSCASADFFHKNGFDWVVGDLSFISLTLVLPALAPLLAPGGRLLLLVKPQFELQPGDIGKGGLVRDPDRAHPRVAQRLHGACAALGLSVHHWLPSPIPGGDGNREFFIHAQAPAAGAT